MVPFTMFIGTYYGNDVELEARTGGFFQNSSSKL